MSRQASTTSDVKTKEWEELRPEVTEELLADITRRIVEAFHPEKVVLFGSYAYGEPNLYSDLDLLVVMESDERPVVRSRKVRKVAKIDFLPMDVLVRTPAEITRRLAMGDFFIREILDRGRTLYTNDTA